MGSERIPLVVFVGSHRIQYAVGSRVNLPRQHKTLSHYYWLYSTGYTNATIMVLIWLEKGDLPVCFKYNAASVCG